jgi:hypothetical protein
MSFLADFLQIWSYLEQHGVCAALVVVIVIIVGVSVYIIRGKNNEIKHQAELIKHLKQIDKRNILYEYLYIALNRAENSKDLDFIDKTKEAITAFLQQDENNDKQ